MPSAYDDLFPAERGQGSVYEPLYPQEGFVGYQLPRWDARRTGGPPSLSGSLEAFARELRAQAGNFDRGARQLFNWLPIGSAEDRAKIADELAAEQQASDTEMASARAAHPMATGAGEGAMYLAAPKRAALSMLFGAILEGLKYGSPLDRLGAAGKGAAYGGLSSLAGTVGQHAIQPGGPGTPQAAGLRDAATRLHAPLSAGQASGNIRTQALEDSLRHSPFGSIPFESLRQQQQAAVNRGMANAVGANAERITSEVYDTANDLAGRAIEDVAARNTLQRSPQTFAEIQAFRQRLAAEAPANAREFASNQFNRFTTELVKNGGMIPGKIYRALNSSLNRIIANTGDGDIKYWTGEVQDVMRSAMGRSISEADRIAWAEANRHYRNLKRLTSRSYVFNPKTGDVNPKAWASVLEGEGDWVTRGRLPDPEQAIADFGRGMPSTAIGSQTQPRQLWHAVRENPLQAVSGLPGEYLPAWLMARGGLANTAPWLQLPLSRGLGYLGRGGTPGVLEGIFQE